MYQAPAVPSFGCAPRRTLSMRRRLPPSLPLFLIPLSVLLPTSPPTPQPNTLPLLPPFLSSVTLQLSPSLHTLNIFPLTQSPPPTGFVRVLTIHLFPARRYTPGVRAAALADGAPTLIPTIPLRAQRIQQRRHRRSTPHELLGRLPSPPPPPRRTGQTRRDRVLWWKTAATGGAKSSRRMARGRTSGTLVRGQCRHQSSAFISNDAPCCNEMTLSPMPRHKRTLLDLAHRTPAAAVPKPTAAISVRATGRVDRAPPPAGRRIRRLGGSAGTARRGRIKVGSSRRAGLPAESAQSAQTASGGATASQRIDAAAATSTDFHEPHARGKVPGEPASRPGQAAQTAPSRPIRWNGTQLSQR